MTRKIDTKIKPQAQPVEQPGIKTSQEFKTLFDAAKLITPTENGVSVKMPCPACAEPDLIEIELLTKEKRSFSAGCNACKRMFSAFIVSARGGDLSYEIVKITGPEMPKWFNAAMKKGAL